MSLPVMSARGHRMKSFAGGAGEAVEGLVLAKTYYAIATYKPGCINTRGSTNCEAKGCGDAETEADARGNAVRNLQDRFPVEFGRKTAENVHKRIWQRYCAADALNNTLSNTGLI